LIDTSTAASNVSSILGVFAELETNLRKERQLEGIASAKARGVDQGARQASTAAKIKQMTAARGRPSRLPAVLAVARYGKPQWSTRPSSADFSQAVDQIERRLKQYRPLKVVKVRCGFDEDRKAARDRHYVTHMDRGANIVIFEFYDAEELADGVRFEWAYTAVRAC
jgi:hypothetical protein